MWREWHSVQVPIVPSSLLDLPTCVALFRTRTWLRDALRKHQWVWCSAFAPLWLELFAEGATWTGLSLSHRERRPNIGAAWYDCRRNS